MNAYAIQTLSTVRRICLLGGHHGDIDYTCRAGSFLADRGVSVILQIGNFTALTRGKNSAHHLDVLSAQLSERHQRFYWFDGDPNTVSQLGPRHIGSEGLHWLRPDIAYVPRGYRTRIGGRFDLHFDATATISAREGTQFTPVLEIDQGPFSRQSLSILDTVTLTLTYIELDGAATPRRAARTNPLRLKDN